jgi:hypothetical protein
MYVQWPTPTMARYTSRWRGVTAPVRRRLVNGIHRTWSPESGEGCHTKVAGQKLTVGY